MDVDQAAGSVGFIGLGTMGREMVINLLKAGHAVRVFDIRREAIEDLVAHGATAGANPQEAAPTRTLRSPCYPIRRTSKRSSMGRQGFLRARRAAG